MIKLWVRQSYLLILAELVLLLLFLLSLFNFLTEGGTFLGISMMISAFLVLSVNSIQIIFSLSSMKETRVFTEYLRSINDAASLKDMPAGMSKTNQVKELAACVSEVSLASSNGEKKIADIKRSMEMIAGRFGSILEDLKMSLHIYE